MTLLNMTYNTLIQLCILSAQNCTMLQIQPNMILSDIIAGVGDPPVTVSCAPDYILDSLEAAKNISCLTDFTWSDTPGLCIESNCPTLTASPLMILSDTTGNIGDPPVTVSCEVGYRLDTNVTELNISCILSSGSPAWNSTIGSCIVKVCPDVASVLGSNMYASTNETTFIYSNTVNLTCTDDLVFMVDYDELPRNRLKHSMQIECQDDPTVMEGVWSEVENCSVPVCEVPGSVTKGVVSNTDQDINSTTLITCKSGYYIYVPYFGHYYNVFHLTATCNASATWVHPFGYGVRVKCYASNGRLGCLSPGSLIPAYSDTLVDNGRLACRSYCQSLNTRLAGVQGPTCSCGFELSPGWSFESVSTCSEACPAFNVSVHSQEAYCGGPSGETEVSVLIDGCYDNLNMGSYVYNTVTYTFTKTCIEQCRALNETHAILFEGNKCTCINATLIAIPSYSAVSDYYCEDTFNSTYYQVSDLLTKSITSKTCEDMFANGVRTGGTYYLKDPIRTESCSFKDGTICDPGWIGFGGNCYYFYTYDTLTFPEAQTECQKLDADVTSILSVAEFNFVNETRSIFTDLWANPNEPLWWTGLTDSTGHITYKWTDGNILSYKRYQENPDLIAEKCIADFTDNAGLWKEVNCDGKYNFGCKKYAVGPHCVDIDSWTPTDPNLIRVDPFMSLTYCIQFCKGQQKTYMLVQNETCYCSDTLPAYTEISSVNCSTSCPADIYQFCGGPDTFTTKTVTSYLPLESCEALQLFGITNGMYLLTSEIITQCGATQCPFGWSLINETCYLLSMASSLYPTTQEDCASRDSYSASFETVQELIDVLAFANNIDQYYNKNWRIGLFSTSRNRGMFRWSNGQTHTFPYWDDYASRGGPDAEVSGTNHAILQTRGHLAVDPFICEKGPDIVGCFDGTSANSTVTNYKEMTIKQCTETCRAASYRYAYIGRDKCSCAHDLVGVESPGQCKSRCLGQYNQHCGNGANLYTVYDLDYYESYITSCIDLFYAGIFISGNYSINGTIQQCNLVDGGTCAPYWLSILGSCYRHFPKTASTREQICRDQGATQVSLPSIEEFNWLSEYVTRVNFNGGDFRIFTGIRSGIYNLDLFISSDGILTNLDLITGGHLAVTDLTAVERYISFRLDDAPPLNSDGGIICKENKYLVGCFELPAWLNLTYTLENFNSMEVGLCRQLCIAKNLPVFLIGNDFCACINTSLLASLTLAATQAACDVNCLIHEDQRCGDGTVVWAYNTGEEDFSYAQSCMELYKNGIFYTSDYKIAYNSSFNETLTQCGVTDETICPAGWFGRMGSCYFFQRTSTAFHSAQAVCANGDGYLFNPIDSDVIDYVYNITSNYDLVAQDVWFTGLRPTTFQMMYTASTGRIVEIDNTDLTSVPFLYTGYNSTDNKWIKRTTATAFICQIDPDYMGCHSISSEPDEIFTIGTNSLTVCSQLCLTNGNTFAAVSIDQCMCFTSLPQMTPSFGNCNMTCGGATHQMCGGYDIHNVLNITSWSGITGTCADVWRYGMGFPGWYLIRYNDTYPFEKTFCFGSPDPVDNIHDIDYTSATSHIVGHEYSSQLSFSLGFESGWIPDASYGSASINLFEDHLITAVTIKGIHSHTIDAYVSSYSLQYLDPVIGSSIIYYGNGAQTMQSRCTDSTDICTVNLLQPFVTSRVYIEPLTWQTNISMQVQLSGVNYKQFDHDQSYIGCVVDYEDDLVYNGSAVDTESCIIMCRTAQTPFASFHDDGDCYCGTYNNFKLGFVNDSNCPLNGTDRLGTGIYKTIYRTYYKLCDTPDVNYVANGSLASFAYTYETFRNTYSAVATFSCDLGFLPTTQDVMCLQDNTWSAALYTCTVFTCDNFTVTNGYTTFTSFSYNGEALVTCNPGYYTENNEEQMTVTCEMDGFWTIIPTCQVGNLQSKEAMFKLISDKIRNVTNLISELSTRSCLDCASRCLKEYYCAGANFGVVTAESGDGGICRLFSASGNETDLLNDTDWEYIYFN